MPMPTPGSATRPQEQGFSLVEALVAMMIVSMVVLSYIGIRTTALLDATYARNWRLAREIAEEKMSALMAGAHELRPESGIVVRIDRYEGWTYKVFLGESEVSRAEGEVASSAAGDNEVANERIEWQRDRENYRRANERGLSAADYESQQQEDVNERLAEKAPSETEFEEVAVVVYFPKLDPEYEGQQDALLIKARLSTLAISGMTPKEAQQVAASRGETNGNAGGAPAPSDAGGDGGQPAAGSR